MGMGTRARQVQALAEAKHALCQLPNVGPATAADLVRLGIHRPEDLADQDPDALHRRLAELDGHAHDPCVRDVLEAAIVHVRDGITRPWWFYSRRRKEAEDP